MLPTPVNCAGTGFGLGLRPRQPLSLVENWLTFDMPYNELATKFAVGEDVLEWLSPKGSASDRCG